MYIYHINPTTDEVFVDTLHNIEKANENNFLVFNPSGCALEHEEKETLLGPVVSYVNPWTRWDLETKMKSVRIQRNYLLEKSDWVTIRSIATGTSEPENWKEYRQKLRDVPKGITSETSLSEINWPQQPAV